MDLTTMRQEKWDAFQERIAHEQATGRVSGTVRRFLERAEAGYYFEANRTRLVLQGEGGPGISRKERRARERAAAKLAAKLGAKRKADAATWERVRAAAPQAEAVQS